MSPRFVCCFGGADPFYCLLRLPLSNIVVYGFPVLQGVFRFWRSFVWLVSVFLAWFPPAH